MEVKFRLPIHLEQRRDLRIKREQKLPQGGRRIVFSAARYGIHLVAEQNGPGQPFSNCFTMDALPGRQFSTYGQLRHAYMLA